MKLCWRTNKRGYTSRAQARMANRHNGHRLKVYRCYACGLFHVSKLEDR